MGNWFLFAMLGLGSGALIAAIALGIVLTYRGSGTINVATGSVAVLTAYVYFGLHTAGYLWIPLPFMPDRIGVGSPWSTLPAFVVSVLAAVLLGVLLELLVVRPLRRAAPLGKLVATLGVLLTAQATIVLRFGSTGQIAPKVLPDDLLTVFGKQVPKDRLYLAAMVIVITAALALIYRYTRFGLSTRAAAENETTARLAGLSPSRLSLVNTVLGSVLAGVLGILVAPLAQLDSTTIPLAVVPALGAALLAGFTSFPIAAGAGLGLGVLQSLTIYAQTQSWFPRTSGAQLPGVTDLIFLLIIIAATFLRGGRLPERGALVDNRLPAAPPARHRYRALALGAIVMVAASLLLHYDFRQALINTLIGIVLCLSLVVLTGLVGQISIVQVALAGVAGFTLQKVAIHAGIGFPLGPLLGIGGATLVGVLLAASSLRVRGVNLAIVTLAAAVAIENFGFNNTTWGAGSSGSPVPRPHAFGLDIGPGAKFPGSFGSPSPGFAMLCGAIVLLLGLFVANLRRSAAGQRMLAVRSNERAAAGAGIDVRRVKLSAFAIAAAMAGTAGCLYAYDFGSISGDRFGLVIALTFVAFAYVGGITTVTGAVIGGLGVTQGLVTQALNSWFGIPVAYQLLVGGLLLVFTVAQNPAGITGIWLDPASPVRGLVQRRMRSGRSPQIPQPADAEARLVGSAS